MQSDYAKYINALNFCSNYGGLFQQQYTRTKTQESNIILVILTSKKKILR